MSGQIELQGMVLEAAPAGEYDRRVVLLTAERGKITAFARGARRQNSLLLAGTVPFSFGRFRLYEGRSAYTLVGAEISNYFDSLKTNFEGAYYGFYFCEFAEYYSQENLDGTDVLNLIYAALLSLQHSEHDKRLVRCAFEVRLMVLQGEFPQDVVADESLRLGTRQAFYHMIHAPVGKLFSFRVNDEILREIQLRTDRIRERLLDKPLRSLQILKTVTETETSGDEGSMKTGKE